MRRKIIIQRTIENRAVVGEILRWIDNYDPQWKYSITIRKGTLYFYRLIDQRQLRAGERLLIDGVTPEHLDVAPGAEAAEDMFRLLEDYLSSEAMIIS